MMLPTTASESGKRPPAPKPWSARKTISSGIPHAAPQSADPTRKSPMETKKSGRRP
jgi:hypothetical protein